MDRQRPPGTDALSNVMVYLVGPPGVGKYTVGSLLAERLPAKLVDNHYWLNPIFGLIRHDGCTPLPREVWDHVAQVRRAVLRTIATVSPSDWNFVLTHAATGSALDREIASEVLETARLRGARLLVVRLSCAPEALAVRVVSPERRLRMKETDPEEARRNAVRPLFDPGYRDTMTIDTTAFAAPDIAALILRSL